MLSPTEEQTATELLGRPITDLEQAVLEVMWSEHCAYKNSKPLLATLPKIAPHVLAGPGENAGVVELSPTLKVAFKIESHNRPTAVEPFQGAATGIGGILRDILTVGARPIAFLDSLHFGPPDDESSEYLMRGAVSGIGHYGNCTGIPTVGGEIRRHSCYSRNPLLNAMCVGLLETEAPIPSATRVADASVVYVGAETGRDGLGGAAFASKGLASDSDKDRPAVQVADPFYGKLLVEACLEAFKTGKVLAAQDMGAAGLICATSEMSAKGQIGLELDLDQVPAREDLTAREFLLSESQERMLLITLPEDVPVIQEIFDRWGLPVHTVGHTSTNGRLRVLKDGREVLNLPPQMLTDWAPVYKRPSQPPTRSIDVSWKPDIEYSRPRIEAELLSRLDQDRQVYSTYDHHVQLRTVLGPGEADAAVLSLAVGEILGLAVTVDSKTTYCEADPFRGSELIVAEAARNLSAVGAKPMAITDNLNFGNPENPESFWYLEQAVAGIKSACQALDLPVISGNVSLYNEHAHEIGGEILPTPVIGMVGKLEDYRQAIGMTPIAAGEALYLLGTSDNEGSCPKLDWQRELALQECLRSRQFSCAHDLSDGGLVMAAAEMVRSGSLGLRIQLPAVVGLRLDCQLFGESPSRALVTMPTTKFPVVPDGLACTHIGQVLDEPRLELYQNGSLLIWLEAGELRQAQTSLAEPSKYVGPS